MDVVIQCAATKDPSAGTLRTRSGKAVHFVAAPHLCSPTADTIYARPDDESDVRGQSWRNRLEAYLDQDTVNTLGLRQAYVLYKHSAYSRLVKKFGVSRVFILSAGWGLPMPVGCRSVVAKMKQAYSVLTGAATKTGSIHCGRLRLRRFL